MTAQTSDFSGLLYYNPAGPGFNPIPDGTVHGPDNMDEGTSASWHLVTWDIPDDNIYWRIVPSGDNLNEGRFTNGGLHGNISVERNRTVLYITVSADNTTSITGQSFDILFSKAPNGTPFAAKYGINVNDTSQTPIPTYTLATAGSVTSVDEGAALTFNVTTTNVANGTVLPWTVDGGALGSSGYTITSGRFSPGTTGSVTINNNTGTFTVTVSADNFTAPQTQAYNISLQDSLLPTPIGNTVEIIVNDTSQSSGGGGGGPPPPSLMSIDVEPQNASIDSTTTYSQQMSATGYYDDNSSQDLTSSASWSIDTEYLSIDSTGLVTIPANAVESGTITAYQDSVTGTATISAYVPVPSPAAFVFTQVAGTYFEVTGSTGDWNFAEDNWTIEWWGKTTRASTGTVFTVMCQGPQNGIDIFHENGDLQVSDGLDGYFAWPEPTPGVWTHVALLNLGGELLLFYNGIRQGSPQSMTGHWYNGTDILYIGQRGGNVSGQNYDGNIYGIRINKNVQYINVFAQNNFDPYSVALPPTKVFGTVLLINPTDQAAADTSDSAHGITYGSPPTGSTSDTPQNSHTYGPIATTYSGTTPGVVAFDIPTYPAIVDVPAVGATMTGTIFASPSSPVTVIGSYVNSGDTSKWLIQYTDPGGTRDTTTTPPDTFTITW
jgi:hypothetical protein